MNPQLDDTLREAAQLLTGARNDAYGDPRDTYSRAAAMWSAMTGKAMTASEAVAFMVCVKLAREGKRHGRDNVVDLAAYAAILQYIQEPVALQSFRVSDSPPSPT